MHLIKSADSEEKGEGRHPRNELRIQNTKFLEQKFCINIVNLFDKTKFLDLHNDIYELKGSLPIIMNEIFDFMLEHNGFAKGKVQTTH